MRLDAVIRDRREYATALTGALEAATTRFYLDTSLLTWLIYVGAEARADFVAWCRGRPVGSVRVPVWAAHELHRHLVSGTVRGNLQKVLNDATGKYDEFARLAVERADEELCLSKNFAGRDAYVSEVRRSAEQLRQMVAVLRPDDEQRVARAADAVVDFVNDHVLAGDPAATLRDLAVSGATRAAHRMPPGYRDDYKPENAFGDVVIWEEIVADVQKATRAGGAPVDVVFVSRDEKTDWVSPASFVRDEAGEVTKGNRDQGRDVTRAHPMLVHELTTRAGGGQLYIVHPGLLAGALDSVAQRRGTASGIEDWLAAADRPRYRPGGRPERPPPELPPPPPPAPDGPERPEDPADGRTPPGPGSLLRRVLAMPVGDVRRWRAADNEAAAAYRAALPDQRAAFVRGWLDDLARGDRSPVDVGNVLALLAAPRDAGVLDGLAADIESLRGTREGVMEGVTLALLAAVYFGRDGELRRRPLGPLGRVLLPLESDPRLAAVFGALGSHLKAAGAELPYVPGTGRPPVRVDVDVAPPTARAPGLLRDLRLGGHPVLVEGAESDADRSLSAMLGRHADRVCTRNELRALVAREFLVPLDRLTMKDDKSKLTWRADAGLSSLDTGSPGGVRAEDAGADDGDEDA